MRYLLDTNIVSEIMKREPEQRVYEWFFNLGEWTICAVSYDEIIFGLFSRGLSQKLCWFHQFCEDRMRVLEITQAIAQWSGEKRAELRLSGKTVTMADSLIGAAAHESGLVLATRNLRDFENMGIALYNPFL